MPPFFVPVVRFLGTGVGGKSEYKWLVKRVDELGLQLAAFGF